MNNTVIFDVLYFNWKTRSFYYCSEATHSKNPDIFTYFPDLGNLTYETTEDSKRTGSIRILDLRDGYFMDESTDMNGDYINDSRLVFNPDTGAFIPLPETNKTISQDDERIYLN